MRYLLLIYDEESSWSTRSELDMQSMYAAYRAYSQELAASGVLRGGAELAPVATATTVRVRNGKVLTTDGPFAETKEQLGGYYLIDVADLDTAIQWASKIPSALHGCIEVRPQTENEAEKR